MSVTMMLMTWIRALPPLARAVAAVDGSVITETMDCPPSRLRCANAPRNWNGTTSTATMVTMVRRLALYSLKAPSRMSPTPIGWRGSGPVRTLPAFASGKP